MFMQHPDEVSGSLDQEFNRPVESIMRCEDFKSNFARRLSLRYSSRSSVTKRQNSLKLPISEKQTVGNAPERIEQAPQLSKTRTSEHSGEVVKPPDKPKNNHNMRDTEVSALNMTIDTLRWQLTQTEANRQMHITLLKQVVTFLSRVKEHIECQNPDPDAGPSAGLVSDREVPPSTHKVDLPRSRSVLHVNKHEYSLTTGKRLSTRKMSKSISNVNGFNDCNGIWNQSKLSLSSDTDNSLKITEEISRLITLANTVLSTKIPDLSCSSNDNLKNNDIPNGDTHEHTESNSSLNLIDEDITNAFILNTIYDSEDAFNGHTNEFVANEDVTLTDFLVSSSTLSCGLENDLADMNMNQKEESIKTQTETTTTMMDKRNDYTQVANFIEDESGFSSMSSFQEIGIPIISIIPPSPCKEVGYIEELTGILDGAEKWKSDTMDLDKQTVKVFWV